MTSRKTGPNPVSGKGPGLEARSAATMFSLNLRQFRDNADVREQVPEQELDALHAELMALRTEGGPPIAWGLRQLVIEA